MANGSRGNLRGEGRGYRKNTHRFFNSIYDLKRAHRKLFQSGISASINRRYVGGSSYGLMTCTVRVLAGTAETAELRPVLTRAMAYLIDQFDSNFPYEVCVLITATLHMQD